MDEVANLVTALGTIAGALLTVCEASRPRMVFDIAESLPVAIVEDFRCVAVLTEYTYRYRYGFSSTVPYRHVASGTNNEKKYCSTCCTAGEP